MSTLSSILVCFTADISDVQNRMNEVTRNLQGVGNRIGVVGKKLSLRITAPLTAMGTAITMTGANFDAAMSKVQAVSGATAEEMDKLRVQAKEIGSTTAFSASQAAEAMGYLGQAGYNTEQIIASMPGLLDMAAAGTVDQNPPR